MSNRRGSDEKKTCNEDYKIPRNLPHRTHLTHGARKKPEYLINGVGPIGHNFWWKDGPQRSPVNNSTTCRATETEVWYVDHKKTYLNQHVHLRTYGSWMSRVVFFLTLNGPFSRAIYWGKKTRSALNCPSCRITWRSATNAIDLMFCGSHILFVWNIHFHCAPRILDPPMEGFEPV